MAFATASSPANREPGDNAQTATPPQAQARPRQSPGNAEPPTSATAPSARQSPPAHARAPSARQSPPAHAGAPSACRSPQRMPEPPTRTRAPSMRQSPPARTRPQRMPEPPTRARTPARQSPQRAPGRKPGSGALTEPSIGLRDVNRAEQRVPAAKNRQLCPTAVKIDDSSQPQGQNTRLFALPESPYANNRQKRPFPTSETAKNRLF